MTSVSQTLTATDLHEVTTEKNGVLGRFAHTADGRQYRYAKNGATALAAGAELQASATTALTSTATADVKPGEAIVPTASTPNAATAALYEDGILTVAGAKYLANGITTGGAISLLDKVDVAIPEDTATSLAVNGYAGVVVKSAGTSIGFAEVAVPAGAYFWARVAN